MTIDTRTMRLDPGNALLRTADGSLWHATLRAVAYRDGRDHNGYTTTAETLGACVAITRGTALVVTCEPIDQATSERFDDMADGGTDPNLVPPAGGDMQPHDGDEWPECGACHGTGRLHNEPEALDDPTCDVCKGKGFISDDGAFEIKASVTSFVFGANHYGHTVGDETRITRRSDGKVVATVTLPEPTSDGPASVQVEAFDVHVSEVRLASGYYADPSVDGKKLTIKRVSDPRGIDDIVAWVHLGGDDDTATIPAAELESLRHSKGLLDTLLVSLARKEPLPLTDAEKAERYERGKASAQAQLDRRVCVLVERHLSAPRTALTGWMSRTEVGAIGATALDEACAPEA